MKQSTTKQNTQQHGTKQPGTRQPGSKATTRLALGLAALSALPAFALLANAQRQEQVAPAQNNTVLTDRRDFSEARLRSLHLPAGFKINAFATGLGNPRFLAVAPNGTVYVSRRGEAQDVVALRDRDGDGRSDSARVVVPALMNVQGLAVHQGRLYFSTNTDLYSAPLKPDGSLGARRTVASNLPGIGQHTTHTLNFSPDGWLYVNIGSSCNACVEPNPENATLIRMRPDGSNRAVYARGLRNAMGFDWHPETWQMFMMDHGIDTIGDNQPPEELNRVEQGRDYGWPLCFGDRRPNVYVPYQPMDGSSKETYCARTAAPVLEYQAHSAPISFRFYTASQFPAAYKNDAFVTMRGSWNRNPPTGYKVVRVHFEQGRPVAFEDFVTGWLIEDGAAHFGRVAGLATAANGSLLIADDANGVIYRVTYTGQ